MSAAPQRSAESVEEVKAEDAQVKAAVEAAHHEQQARSKSRTSAGIFEGIGAALNPLNWFKSAEAPKLTTAILKQYLPSILANLPHEWRGTTFKNSALLGRVGFCDALAALLVEKHATGATEVTEADLVAVGNAEDYFRVSSNISTLLELVLALDSDLPVDQIFTWASTTMSLVAICLTAQHPVELCVADGIALPFTDAQLATLKLIGCHVTQRVGGAHPGQLFVVLSLLFSP